MKQSAKCLLGIAGVFSALGIPAMTQETGQPLIDRELDYLMTLWSGDFDNQEQVSFDTMVAVDSLQKQSPFHALVHAIDMPSLGDNVLYVEERPGGDVDKVNSQRVYVLSPSESEQAIRVKTYVSCLVDWLRIGSKSLYAMKIIIQKGRICPNAKFGRSFAASPLI